MVNLAVANQIHRSDTKTKTKDARLDSYYFS